MDGGRPGRRWAQPATRRLHPAPSALTPRPGRPYDSSMTAPAALAEALAARYRLDRQLGEGGMATTAEASCDAHITFHLAESNAVAGDSQTALRLLDQAVERGFYPHGYIAVHCPFLASLRGTAEFDRIAARAARRGAEFVA